MKRIVFYVCLISLQTVFGAQACCWAKRTKPTPVPLTSAQKHEDFIAAVSEGNLAKVTALTTQGADLNKPDANGSTPLIHGVYNNRQDVVLYLLAQKADPNTTAGSTGVSALQIATEKANQFIVKGLIESKANTNMADLEGRTALIDAAAQGKRTVASMIIDAGADVHTRDNNGINALMAAYDNDRKPTAETLLKWGSNSHDLETLEKRSDLPQNLASDPREPEPQNTRKSPKINPTSS